MDKTKYKLSEELRIIRNLNGFQIKSKGDIVILSKESMNMIIDKVEALEDTLDNCIF